MFSAKLMDGTYCIFPKIRKPHNNIKPNSDKKFLNSNQVSAYNVNSVNTWLSCFAHVGKDLIVQMSKSNSVFGLLKLKFSRDFCKPCRLSK